MSNIDDEKLKGEVISLIAEVLEIEPEKITMEANFIEDLGMDSMMALEILAAIEKRYKIRIPEEQLMKLRTLRETISLTEEYLKKVS